MRVLVTGGAGFIGSHVVDRLVEAGAEPRILDLRPSPHRPGVQTVIGDLRDEVEVRRAVHGCDAVVHLAAMADVDAVARRPEDAEQVNSRGTLNVLEAARGASVRRVVYASTIWVYSDAGERAVDEDTPLGLPAHLYTATKLAGEMYCRSYGELYGLEYTILRFGIPYGPRARPAAVVPTFVRKALAGEPLTIAGDGRQSRRFVYVEDLADGVVRALAPAAANRVYNLVGDEDTSVREIANSVRDAVGAAEVVHVPGRNGDFDGLEVSGERAERELGWTPATPFADGVRRYLAWHLAEDAAPAAPAPERSRARPMAAAARSLVQRAAPAALLGCVGAMLGLFLEMLHSAGAGGDDLRTAAITSLMGLTLYFAVVPDPDAHRRASLAGVGWLTAGVMAALVLHWPHDALRLAHSDVDLLVLSTTGAAFGVATGAAGRRLLRAGMSERPSDAGG